MSGDPSRKRRQMPGYAGEGGCFKLRFDWYITGNKFCLCSGKTHPATSPGVTENHTGILWMFSDVVGTTDAWDLGKIHTIPYK